MKTDARRQAIMDFLLERGSAGVDDIASRFMVSRMTVHRDLDQLEAEGLLRKVRGGATVQSSSQFESDFRYRARISTGEKAAIAAEAAGLVEPGQSLILDDGSTSAAVVPHLLERRPLTVITNNADAIRRLMGVQGVKLFALGGEYNRRFHGFFGLLTEQALTSVRADAVLLSTSSVADGTAFHQDQEIVKTKRAMIAAADRRHLLADSAKFDKTALHVLTALSDFDTVVSGAPLSARARAGIAEAGVALRIAEPLPAAEGDGRAG